MRLFIAVILLFVAFPGLAQTFITEPVPVVVLPFKEYYRDDNFEYNNNLTSKLVQNLKSVGKFDVLVNDKAALEAISDEVARHEFVEDSQLDFEALKGARYILEASMSGYNSAYYPVERDSDGDITQEAYYEVNMTGIAKIIDINTREYLYTIEVQSRQTSANRERCYSLALDALPDLLLKDLKRSFLIKTQLVRNTTADEFELDKGRFHGVREGMWFEIYPIMSSEIKDPSSLAININRMGKLKVSQILENQSLGRLREGSPEDMLEGWIAIETDETDVKDLGVIVDKKMSRVYLDAGKDLGFRKGQTFKVIKTRDKDIGEQSFEREKFVGEIYLKDVQEKYSVGKLFSGIYAVKEGMSVIESNVPTDLHFFNLQYGQVQGFFQPANNVVVPIKTDSYPEQEEPHDYTGFNDIETVHAISLQYQYYNRLNHLSFGFNLDYRSFNSTDGMEMQNLVPMATVGYDIFLVPELISLTPNVGLGFSRLRQRSDLVTDISNDEDDWARSRSIYLSSGVRANLYIKYFRLFAGADFVYASHNDWDYYIVNGVGQEDVDTEKGQVGGADLPYQEITLSNLTYYVGISYILKL